MGLINLIFLKGERKFLSSSPQLLIQNFTKKNSGIYICNADNGLGVGLEKRIKIELYGK